MLVREKQTRFARLQELFADESAALSVADVAERIHVIPRNALLYVRLWRPRLRIAAWRRDAAVGPWYPVYAAGNPFQDVPRPARLSSKEYAARARAGGPPGLRNKSARLDARFRAGRIPTDPITSARIRDAILAA